MITHFYPVALRIITCIIAVCSAVSATLLWTAPPPQEFPVLEPAYVQLGAVFLMVVLGVVVPVAALIAEPLKYLLLKIGLFTAAGFGNALMLSPLIVVPLQETFTAVAAICSAALTIASIVTYMESVERRNARRRATT
ncbi:hypothetical protein LFT48_05610 [Arthrobacter sp. FW305-123]|nr:hypothetical protein LFT48_05610 [Arthrobacter sp. FW305-123]